VSDLLQRFSIRESDRCLETRGGAGGAGGGDAFQYPRVGSLPRNLHGRRGAGPGKDLSVSASRIVASKPMASSVRMAPYRAFSIRESDRCLETRIRNRLRAWQERLSVSASRIVASKLEQSLYKLLLGSLFQYPRVGSLPRNQQSCRSASLSLKTFQYPRVGSLPRNMITEIRTCKRCNTFSIRESDRCLETTAILTGKQHRQHFQYPRVGSLPRNAVGCRGIMWRP